MTDQLSVTDRIGVRHTLSVILSVALSCSPKTISNKKGKDHHRTKANSLVKSNQIAGNQARALRKTQNTQAPGEVLGVDNAETACV